MFFTALLVLVQSDVSIKLLRQHWLLLKLQNAVEKVEWIKTTEIQGKHLPERWAQLKPRRTITALLFHRIPSGSNRTNP